MYSRRCLRMITKKIFHAGFGLLCASLTLYVAVLAFIEYYHNADATNISFKTFNVPPVDENPYPDITFCFNGRKHLYKKEFLKRKYSLSDNDYYELLSGSEIVWSNISNHSLFTEIDFDEASLDISDFMPYYYLGLHGGISNLTRHQVIRKTYAKPGFVCFTRQFGNDLEKGELVRMESFKVRLRSAAYAEVSIFAHYPNQTLRTVFGRDRLYKTIFRVTNEDVKSSNHWMIDLSHMTVLKRRHDAVVRCDPRSNDDIQFWKEIFSRISCLPPYWRQFIPHPFELEDCDNATSLQAIKKLTDADTMETQIKEKDAILSSILMPCNKMEIVTNDKIMKSKDSEDNEATIAFVYRMDSYQEIRNYKEFGFFSLWSYIGGYLGLFLGYSFFSLLDDAYSLLEFFYGSKQVSGLLK